MPFVLHGDFLSCQEICRFLRHAPILLFTDLFQPVDHLAVLLFLYGDMRHGRGRRGTMPVLLAGREPDHVTGTDLLDRSSFPLSPPAAGHDDERLTEWMSVPRSPCAGLEGYTRALNERRIGRLKKRIDSHRACEPLGRAFRGRLRPTSFDLQ